MGSFRLLAVAGVLCLGLVLCLWRPAALERAALPFEDLKFSVRTLLGAEPRPDPSVVVVAIDEPSLKKLGRWPWPRDLIGALLARLREAELIGLDLVFPETADPREDEVLARSVAEAGNVVLGYVLREAPRGVGAEGARRGLEEYAYRSPALDSPVVGLPELEHAQANAAGIAAGALSGGFLNAEPDPDGLFRRYPIAYLHQGQALTPLAVQLVQYHLDRKAELVLDSGGVRSFALGGVRASGTPALPLNFVSPAEVRSVSAAAVLEGRVAPSFFRGKIALVGVTAAGIREVRPTPVDPAAPGVFLHYTAASNLLGNRLLRTSAAVDLALLVLACLLAGAGSLPSAPLQRIGVYCLALAAPYAAGLYCLLDHHVWVHDFSFLLPALFLSGLLEAVTSFRAGSQGNRLRVALSSSVSAEVLGELLAAPERAELGGALKEVSVLCAELRGLPALVERFSPAEVVRRLAQLEEPMARTVLANRGLVDGSVGPGMTALFNAPHDVADHPARACRAALDLVRSVRELNAAFAAEGLPEVSLGVGVCSGACVVGAVGGAARFRYAAAGDAVELASRLGGLCEAYGAALIVSEATKERLTEGFLVRRLDRLRVRGRRLPSSIFEVLEESERNRELALRYQEALELYFQRQFFAAATLFEELSAGHGDPPSALFAERCARYGQKPPPPDWDGVFTGTAD
ncbi:MAG: adenylate/guanylate cyclase domain-containing protein [Deltaproteobacteria bacterium]|nr:adenylate/guanylate cyclase domain-containing protein [Deltaproteobacteria bacterium]